MLKTKKIGPYEKKIIVYLFVMGKRYIFAMSNAKLLRA